MAKLIGYVLVAVAIAFLAFSIYRATDAIAPRLDQANQQIAGMRADIEAIKAEIPSLARTAGEQATKGAATGAKKEAGSVLERAISPDPRKHLDPLGIFD